MARRAVVIGSGPNGLAGAIELARAGFDVEVHEEQPTIGGGARTMELTLPGFRHDVCSAIHPLGERSPFFRGVDLELDWIHPPAPAAHPFDDGSALVLERDPVATASQLGEDGAAYRRLLDPFVESWETIEPLIIGPLPFRLRQALAAVRRLGIGAVQRSVRVALGDARSVAEKTFRDERVRGFFSGHAAHSMLPMERRPSAGFALILLALGHALGWPFPRGGAQTVSDALAEHLRRLGGDIHVGSRVDELPRADVVLADVVPRELLRLARGRFPARYERQLRAYRHGPGVFKLDWALDGPIPWQAHECARAGTVHLGATLGEISRSEWSTWAGGRSERPFVLLAQHSLFDDSRAPAGKHTAWAYCHVPHESREDMTDAIEGQVERFAPGFRDRIIGRSALDSAAMESHNRNYVGGDINGGAMDLAQLFTRPVRARVPYRTPLRGVYICSSATPPGGGVHGMCGVGAARAALRDLAE